MNGRRDDVIGALAHVDVIIGVYRFPEFIRGKARDDLVDVHVGTGPGTGLKHVDGKVFIIFAAGNGFCALLNGRGDFAVE